MGYTQDAQGNRTSRTVDGLLDATWAWDDVSSLPMRIGEYDPARTLTTGWLPDPTSSTGASLAQTSGGSSSWLLNDPFANTVASVSTTGNTVSGTRSMDAFGVERTTATGSLADASVGFAGQYLDGATGLYDMRARDYDPSSGRFTATDPVDVPTGMPYVAGYSYARNSPLTMSDPSGLFCIPIAFAGQGDCRSIGERVAPKSEATAGLVDGTADFVVGTGYLASPDGVQAGWNSFQQDRRENGTWAAILNSAGGGAGGALAANDMMDTLNCSTGPVFCTRYDMARSAAHAGLTLAQTELLLTASLRAPEAGYCGPGSSVSGMSKLFARARVAIPASEAGEIVLPFRTPWGWSGSAAYRAVVGVVRGGGTIEELGGVVPTQTQAMQLIIDAGGTIQRIEGPHLPPNPHVFPHINYTTPSGWKGTLRILEVEEP